MARLVFMLSILVFSSLAAAQTPVVDTVISLSKTGSEPFDAVSWTGDGPGGTVGGVNAGQDADEDDNIVRLQDSITYRVEVSVNDSDVDDLVSTVTLNEKQKWIAIPTGCKTDPADVGTQPVSSISPNGTVLTCNLGPAVEGTTKVFFPTARAVGVDPVTGDVTRNDDIVTAGVSSQAFSAANGTSAAATDGPTEVIVTGFFRVDLQKELKTTTVDPVTGDPYYVAPRRDGPAPDNRSGSLMEYTVLARYVKGSLLADGDLDTTAGGSPGVASYRIIDVLTDDNLNNDTATSSTGAQLYTWNPNQPACELLGNHGASAAVTCTQIAAAIDDIGPGATAPDGVNDLVIQIDLTDIDVTDPDNDANLFEVRLNVWFDRANDIDSHQDCAGGGTCISTNTNRVGFWDGASTTLDSFDEDNDVDPFNNPGIMSTEDASGNKVGNYNAGQEPFPNEVSYPLITSIAGSISTHKSFDNIHPFAVEKFPDQDMAAGETRPFIMNVFDYRKIDQAETIMCDKIDTQVFEYAGVAPPNQIGSPTLYFWNQNRDWNPVVSTFFGPNGTTLGDGSDLVEFFFTNHPYTADPVSDQAGYINELRTATCEDDVNGDGSVIIQQADGSLVDENGDPAVGTIDWWVNADDVPPFGGAGGAAANVTRVRQDSIYDAAFANAQDPAHGRFAVTVNHLITAKLISASPYGSNNRLPNFASYNTQQADGSYIGWRHVGVAAEDPNADATFAIQSGTVDRMTLVPSSHSIAKYTDPRGIKVVRGGDNVDFIIEGQVFGIWDDTTSNTATIGDNLPAGTVYVANSEMFSSDGGTTWYTRADWDARFLAGTEDVEVTSAPHAGGADPLSWVFGSLNSSGGVSDKLPMIKYTVAVDPEAVSGTFVNIATIDSGAIGGAVKQARYQLTILPEFGLDVLKIVDEPIYEVNSPFVFDLVYKNLGGEDYAAGEFIDILPYNGDAALTTGGVSSSRDPESGFNGVFDINSVSSSNGETFFATVAVPTTIEEDPCHASNLPAGFDPAVSGGVCELYLDREGTLPGGGLIGTNATGWVQCTVLNPLTCGALDNTDITAIKFSAPALPAAAGGQTVTIELEPVGNLGGTPVLDATGNVIDGAGTGDIYTNTFGGRIAEISLNVISNDVSVTMVDGSIGNYVWWDAGADGVQENDPIAGVTVELLDAAGLPIYVDPATNAVVPSTYPGAIPYTTTTNAMGEYLFDHLPSGDYQVRVTPPPAAAFQTYDFDGTGTANISAYTLSPENDASGQLVDVEDDDQQDFGYARNPILTLVKVIDDSAGGSATLADFPLTFTNAASSVTDTGVSGTPAVTDVPVPPDTYFLSEPAVLDYTASDFVCVGGADTDPSDGITLTFFEDVTCTITNTYVPPPVPEIAVTKAGTLNDNGTIDYTITVENIGPVDVMDIVVTDPLIGALTYLAADDADNDQDIDLLTPGGTAVVTGTYTLTEADFAAGEVENQAGASGTGPRGQPAVDDSDSENPVDDTGGEDDPTVTPLPNASIGVAKDLQAGSPVDLGNGSYQVTYEFVVSNTGGFDLSNVQLTDDLQAMINTPNPNNATYATPVVSSPNGSLTPNPSFNGSGNQNMLTGTDTLLVGEVGLLELTFVFTPDVYFGPFENQAEASGEGPVGVEVTDLSEDGPSVNPDSDSPTPFAISTPSTPITLGWFTSRVEGGYIVFEWATEVEVSNAGFNISARNKAGEWQQINPQMIPSQGDSISVQRYEYLASSVSGTTFRFSDVSITGRVVNHGPFELGETYGTLGERKATDWNQIERESESKQRQREEQQRLEMQERLNQLKHNGPQSKAPSLDQLDKASEPSLLAKAAGALLSLLIAPANAAELVSFEVEESGLYRVTHAQLLAQGLDLTGINTQRIGLKQDNRLWPMQVYPKTNTEFSSSSYLLFPGSGVDTLYTGTNKYVLVLDEGSKQVANDTTPIPQNTSPAPSYLAEATYAPQNHYTHISPSDNDSWYADSLKAISGAASKQVSLTIDEYAPAFNTSSFSGNNNARMPALRPRLELSMWGNSDFPGNGLTKPDHLIQVDVNDERVRDVRFDGLHLSNTETALTNLQAGTNSVSLTLPKNHGYRFDLVNLDRVSLRYPRRFKAQRSGSSLEFNSDWNFFRIFGLASNTVTIVRVDNAANNDVQAYSMTARGTGPCTSGCVYFAGSNPDVSSEYYIATGGGFRTPAIKPLGARNDIFSSQAKYLIIAHPDFINTPGLELESYASELAQKYGTAKIVDVTDIYAHFSGHVMDANAIHAYIKQAYAQLGTRHAMIVGGDNQDYRNYLGTNARSFIPSLYVPITMNVNAVPSDSSYADVDGDFVPDITITRLPVRNTTELMTLLSKRQRYLAGGYAQTAMFAADKVDGSGYSFKMDAQKLINDHFGGWAVNTAYVDDMSISQGKAQILSTLGSGAALTSYSGHSSTDRWSISGLFTGSDVTSLSNTEKPTVITQWGCWNTFYTSPEQDSLAQRLLVESTAGAVTVMGATSFTKADAEQRMADLLFARLKQGLPIGEAVLSAKRAMAAERPYQLDVLLGWTVLGPDDMAIQLN